jgi:hypothetical protein
VSRRILYARVELVREGIDRLGIDALWHSVVAVHALRVGGPATEAILADLPLRDPSWTLDLLEGLQMDERSVLYEYSLAHHDRHSRKSSGQFFTPDDVARFLAERAAAFPEGTWIDPCCGVGNLSYWLADAQPAPASFVAERLVLVDRDPLALLIARALLATEFGLDAAGYAALCARSRVADALADDLADDLPPFDYALLNPPYVVVPRDDRFASAEARDLYAYFIERMLDLGRGVVAISPQSFTSGRKFAPFRRMLVDRLTSMDVYCFDNVPDNVFRGVKFGSQNTNRVNSTRAAVLVGRTDGIARHRITPLLRWRAHERAELFAAADDFLAPLQADADRAFPKVGAALVPLHAEMLGCATTVGQLATGGPFELAVPVTPRYFLSAVKRVLARGHVHRLAFPTPEARDLAYVVLNSSLAYWWWRVYEGGITISKSTLASVPVSIVSSPLSLVRGLEHSERENVVVKRNAGRLNENVKHPWRLLRDLNRAVAPTYVDDLLATHANSHLGSPRWSSSDRRSRVETPPSRPHLATPRPRRAAGT